MKKPTGFRTTSDIEIRQNYFPNDGGAETGKERPGEFPYTRGIRPEMYRGKLWTMRQYAGFATAKESNARYRYLLEKGTTGLSVAFDLLHSLCWSA